MTGTEAERVEQLVLEIAVSDLDKSLAIYTALGFALDRRDGAFAALRWGDSRLFLSESRDLPPGIGPSRGNVRIIVPDVDRMWSLALELSLPVEREIADRYYGLRDFSVFRRWWASARRPSRSSPRRPRSPGGSWGPRR